LWGEPPDVLETFYIFRAITVFPGNIELVETGTHLETFSLFPTYPQSPLLDFSLSPFHNITSFHLFHVSNVPYCFLSDFLDIQGFHLIC